MAARIIPAHFSTLWPPLTAPLIRHSREGDERYKAEETLLAILRPTTGRLI
jgi:hypothetical protein